MPIPADRVGSWWGPVRGVLLLGCLLGSAAAAIFGAFAWIDQTAIAYPDFGMNAVAVLSKRIARIGEDPDRQHVVFLGDSTVMSYPLHRTVPERLERALQSPARAASTTVHSLALPGLGPFEHYYAARAIAERRPAAVVIAFNPACLADAWRDHFSRPQLAGLLRPAQIPQALSLPLHDGRVTTDRLLLYVAALRLGGFDAWYWLAMQQSRITSARQAAAVWLAAGLGKDGEQRFLKARNLRRFLRYRIEQRDRYGRWAVERHYGVLLAGRAAGHPSLEMLRAAIREFGAWGVATLTYAVPINVEHFESLGLVDRARVRSSLDAIEGAVREAGGDFIDLHDLLPDAGYRDGAGHFSVEGAIDGPARVAAKLRGRVAALLREQAAPD